MKTIYKKVYYFFSFKLLKFKIFELKSRLGYCGLNVNFEFPLIIHGAESVKIFDNVSIAAFVHIWGNGGVEIGQDSLIASHVSITSLSHDKNAILYKNSSVSKAIKIGNNVWIGSHAIILPGISIGNNAIIGAGAVVNRDVLDNEVVKGVPINKISLNSSN